MATFAPELSPPAYVAPARSTISIGSGVFGSAEAFSFHGSDLKSLLTFTKEAQEQSSERLARLFVGKRVDRDGYSAPPPLRSFFVNVQFERGGEIVPAPIDFDIDED